jgi:outer membrane immunogenic protein
MNLQKIKALLICLAVTSLAAPTTAIAGADSGFYIGAGAGDATIKDSGFDESDSAYKILAGYNIGFIPFVDFAVEGSYVDFGNPSTTTVSAEATGFDAFGLVGLNFGPVGVFAKAGAISWDLKTNTGSDSGTDPAYGIGAKFSFLSFAVRAEYEVFEFDKTDVDMVSVSATYTF